MTEVHIIYTGPIVSRKEAISLKLTTYFNVKPCKHGHIAQRDTNKSYCIECRRAQYHKAKAVDPSYGKESRLKYSRSEHGKERKRKYNIENKEHLKARKLEYTAKNTDRIREYKAKYRSNNRDKINERQRLRQVPYNPKVRITKQELIAKRQKPDICDICKGNHHRGIMFDHCHTTGNFRGWICDRCNKTLGLVKDKKELLNKMIGYLESNDSVNDKTT